MDITKANQLATLEMLRDQLAAARVHAVLAKMDEHFISELNNLQSVVYHHIEEATAFSCHYRTDRGTCGLLDKEDHTYPCNKSNCPDTKEAK